MPSVRPIDVHVHPPTPEFLRRSGGQLVESALRYFGQDPQGSIDALIAEYEGAGLRGVLLGWDAETATGLPPTPNDLIADIVARAPGTFIGFAGVDPWKQDRAEAELERAVRTLRLRGVKFHPIAQAFYPNDPRFRSLFALCEALGVPALFHTGTTALGARLPGGGGLRLDFGRPIPYLDELAAALPRLTIIAAHPSWPWTGESLAMALHKANVYLDLSGWSPRYFPAELVQYANTLLQDKCLFGSDYPFLHPVRWLRDFDAAGFRAGVREKILATNAASLLGLPPA